MYRTARLTIATALALTGSAALAANYAIDTANTANGLNGIYSATFDGGLTACGGGSTTYCTFFGGDPALTRNVTSIPVDSGVVNNVPGGIGPTGIPVAPVPASGSFLDLTLGGGNTTLTLGQSSITFGVVDICISQANGCQTINVHAVDAGMVFDAPQPAIAAPLTPAGGGSTGTTTVPIDGSGKAVFEVQNGGGIVLDFSRFSQIVTSCTGGNPPVAGGGQCALVTLDVLNLDVIRYVLEIDWDPTFTSFTGRLIGQTSNNSFIFVRMNSAGADQDGDNVVDTADNCPVNANGAQTNSDADARGDACDNCRMVNNMDAGQVANAPGTLRAQLDADKDGFGNICDADINNSGSTATSDYTLLRNVLNHLDSETTCTAPCVAANIIKSDMNGSGSVTTADYTLLRNRLNTAPGPSGLACATLPVVTIPCPAPPPF